MARARGSVADGSAWRDQAWEDAFTVDGPPSRRRAGARPASTPARASSAASDRRPGPAADRPAPGPARHPAGGVPGRRTITIQGRGAERELFLATYQSRRRPSQPPHKRAGFKPDRVAMWAVLLGVVLVLVAAASAHAAASTRAVANAPAAARTCAVANVPAAASTRALANAPATASAHRASS